MSQHDPMPPGFRDIVRQVTRELVWRDHVSEIASWRINDLYTAEIAAWEYDHKTLRRDWQSDQWQRFLVWQAVGWSVPDATFVWRKHTRLLFACYLRQTGRIRQ